MRANDVMTDVTGFSDDRYTRAPVRRSIGIPVTSVIASRRRLHKPPSHLTVPVQMVKGTEDGVGV